MCNPYTKYNLNSYIFIIVIVFNCTMHMHGLYTGNNNSKSVYWIFGKLAFIKWNFRKLSSPK